MDEAIKKIVPASELLWGLRPIVNGVGEESKATLQVTTLGRKGQEHTQALAETSTAITELNYGQEEFNDLNRHASRSKRGGTQADREARAAGQPGGSGGLPRTLETAVKIVVFGEHEESGYGTVKNMPYVLPRRIIAPPLQGFAAALGMDRSKYE